MYIYKNSTSKVVSEVQLFIVVKIMKLLFTFWPQPLSGIGAFGFILAFRTP